MGVKHSTIKSFGFAFSGIKTALVQEPNFRIHIVIAILATAFAVYLGLSSLEWLILIFTIFFVLIMELVNTAIEAVVDIVSPEVQEKAKVAKDVSAAAVLLTSVLAVAVGALIFFPKLLAQPFFL